MRRRNTSLSIFFSTIVCLLLISACTQKATEITGTAKKCKSRDINFKYFSAKAKINYTKGEENTSFTANIRMKKDKIIWLSASVLGFEGIRCKITPDSIFVKQSMPSKKYYVFSFDELSKRFNTPLSFDIIQSVFLGNKPLRKSKNETITTEGDKCVIEQQEPIFTILNHISLQNSKIEKLEVSSKSAGGNMEINYSDFKTTGKHLFPYKADVQISYKNDPSSSLDIKYKSANFTSKALKFPFKVSDKYVRQ